MSCFVGGSVGALVGVVSIVIVIQLLMLLVVSLLLSSSCVDSFLLLIVFHFELVSPTHEKTCSFSNYTKFSWVVASYYPVHVRKFPKTRPSDETKSETSVV